MTKAEQVLVAAYNGEKHTMSNSILASLCCRDLIKITERHPKGTAKKIELTEAGRLVAFRFVAKRINK